MSAAFIRRDFMSKVIREIAAVACLFALPMAAQQANTGMAVQSGQEPTSKSMPDAPKAKSLPEPTNVDYSKPTPLLLSVDEQKQLVAFLKSLTDPAARDMTGVTPASVPSGLTVKD